MTATAPESSIAHLAGKYLAFILGHETYSVPVLKVREIIRLCPITPVPRVPSYMKGVINLRGKIIPVLDLRQKFQLENVADTERTCIIVVQVRLDSGGTSFTGLIVDAVEEVVNLAADDLEPTPDFGASIGTEFILGMAKVKDGVKTLLDIDRVVASDAAAFGAVPRV